MGALAPLYLAGLAALSLPLILHLIRRTPRGRQEFSSLMFLTASPPRLTRRSRLDQILLLLVRLAALAALAFAFARPFMRESSMLSLGDLPSRRVAILLDNSSSMRRGDLWQQAKREVEGRLDALSPQDDVALFTFADGLKAVSPFAADQDLSPRMAVEALRQQLALLEPSWGAGDIGAALSTLAAELDASTDLDASHDESQIVLISDFQKGNRLDALQAFEWPAGVHVFARPVTLKATTNAYVQLMESDDDSQQEPRLRITSASNSVDDQFYVRWSGGDPALPTGEELAVYVPPGQSRVVKLPRPENNSAVDRVVLRGDDHDFDNICYIVAPPKQEVHVAYDGADASDDPAGLQYYLRLASTSDALRQIHMHDLAAAEVNNLKQKGSLKLVVCTRPLADDVRANVKAFVESGGTLLWIATDRESATAMTGYFDDAKVAPSPTNNSRGSYALLAQIDFTHPVFVPFANPRYSDFTKIHFWQHRPLTLSEPFTTRVVARFDDGSPWLIERTLGRGRVLGLSSGWQPDDSQLAVSSKFVGLIGGILDQACGVAHSLAAVAVDEVVPMSAQASESVVHVPGGSEVKLAAGATRFEETHLPGVYRIGENDGTRFAVNLAASESDTAPLDMEQLQQLGVPIGGEVTAEERLSRLRQQRDTELENQQKLWRWLLVGCLGLLITETWMAARASQPAAPTTRTVA